MQTIEDEHCGLEIPDVQHHPIVIVQTTLDEDRQYSFPIHITKRHNVCQDDEFSRDEFVENDSIRNFDFHQYSTDEW